MAQFYAWLGVRKSARIRLAVMDMWKPFRTATQAHAPQALTTHASALAARRSWLWFPRVSSNLQSGSREIREHEHRPYR
jgi:hypothetical protein